MGVFGALAGTMLAGCASPGPVEPLPHYLPEHPARSEGPPARATPSEKAELPAPPDPVGDLTLGRALEVSLARSPKLRAFGLEVRRAEALELQAGLRSNPEIDSEVENIGGSGELAGLDAAETTISLVHTFPLGGDLARRRELAGERTRLANWDYEAARLEVMVEVAKAFVEALATDRRVTLARQELEWTQAMQQVATTRVEAGDASPVELSRVVVPVITAELGLKRAERLRDATYRRLSLTWDGRHGSFDRVVGDLDQIPAAPDLQVLVRHIQDNPEVARWAAAIGERMAERRLAKAEATPDLTARVGLKNVNQTNDTGLVVGLSLPLPLFDRRQGDILAARQGEMAARARQRETELWIESMLSQAYAKLLSSRDEAVALREEALPAANRAHEATRQSFAAGKLAFLDVLEAQRTLFELQRRYLDALVVYHAMTAEIESLIGQRLSDLTE